VRARAAGRRYIASGDAAGRVRVWAYTHPEHLLKYELPSIGGEVEDVAWDSESKRLLAVGGGSAKAKFFAWDTGSQLGEVVPHNKKNLTCDFKPARPFKAVMGGEDFTLSFYGGPPFRYEKALKDHTNFVNCVRYAPDGSRFISVGADKAGIIYDGTSGGVVGSLDTAGGHTGSIYAVAWHPAGTHVVTASGDKSLKIWDMGAAADKKPCIATIPLGKATEDMQQGVVWAAADVIVSLSLDGTLNVVNPGATADGPVSRIRGHQAPATCLDYDAASGTFYTADAAGRTCVWRPTDDSRTAYVATVVSGEVAAKKAAGVSVAGGTLAVAAWDDKLRVGDAAAGTLTAVVPLPGQPKGVAVSRAAPGIVVVATGAALVVVAGGAPLPAVEAPWAPTCLDLAADGTRLAVGGKDKKVHFYTVAAGGALTADGETKELAAEVSVVRFSPDGSSVAVGDAAREVRLYAATGAKDGIRVGRWTNHTTRVTGVRWAPSGRAIASVSTDRRICIWDPTSDIVKTAIDLAHPQPFADVAWSDDTTLWTLGTDGVLARRVLAL